eukprot:3371897-Pyramimonas_sp.AAC.1
MSRPRLPNETIELGFELGAHVRRDHFWRAEATKPALGDHLLDKARLQTTTGTDKTRPLERGPQTHGAEKRI